VADQDNTFYFFWGGGQIIYFCHLAACPDETLIAEFVFDILLEILNSSL